MTQPVMPSCGRWTPAAANSCSITSCSIGAGVAAPRLGPVRHRVAVLDQRARLRAASSSPSTLATNARTSSRYDSASGGRSTVRSRRTPARTRSVVGRRRLVGVDQRGDGERPPHVHVAVVLPREADAAVHLHVEVRAEVGGRDGQRGRDGGGVGELLAAAGRGTGRVPHRRGGQLGGDGHVGAVVLHGLEHGDRAAELQAGLGVLGGEVGRTPGRRRRPRRRGSCGRRSTQRLAGTGEHARRRRRRTTPGRCAGSGRGWAASSTVTPRRRRVDHGDVVADRRRAGRRPARRRARRRPSRAARRRATVDLAAEPDARRWSSRRRGRAGSARRTSSVPAAPSTAAAISVGTNAPGASGPAELLDDDDELLAGRSPSRRAPRRRGGRASRARRRRRRRRRSAPRRRVEQRPRRRRGLLRFVEEVGDGVDRARGGRRRWRSTCGIAYSANGPPAATRAAVSGPGSGRARAGPSSSAGRCPAARWKSGGGTISRGGAGGLWSTRHSAASGAPTRLSISRTTSSDAIALGDVGLDPVADPHRRRRLGRATVDPHVPAPAGGGRQRPRPVQPHRPQPLVDAEQVVHPRRFRTAGVNRAAASARRRVPKPVAPFERHDSSASTFIGPAMSRWAQGVSPTNSDRNTAAVIAPPYGPPTFLTSATSESSSLR